MKTKLLRSLAITLVLVVVISCKNEKKEQANNADSGFTIQGTIKDVDSGVLNINYNIDGEWGRDSIVISNGQFSYTGKVDYPHISYIKLSGSEGYPTPFFIENSAINVVIDTSSEHPYIIKGSKSNDEYDDFLKLTEGAYKDKIIGLYDLLDTVNDDKKEGIENQIDSLSDKITVNTKKYISGHPKSYVTAEAISSVYGYNPDIKEYEQAYNSLDISIKESGIGKKIAESLAAAKRVAVGQPSTNLTLNDTEGNPITLSSLKGQYVLIDFWASWCAPCRAENPNVKKAYAKYHNKGFEIYAVSLDTNKESWIKAIEEDSLPWLHVSDLKNDNEAAIKYGVQGIPMNYLLDKDGIIIAKGLRGKKLEERLKTLF